jgi:hypothetical protein
MALTHGTHRKTIGVAEILVKANYFLQNSKPEQVAERKATHSLMSSILSDTGNYQGFGYHGMIPNPDGMYPTIPDESRTFFYVSRYIKGDYDILEKERKERGY